MNNIISLVREASDPVEFAKCYFTYVASLSEQLEKAAVASFITELESARTNHQTVFIVGNGGSASTASHMATDLGFRTGKMGEGPSFRVLSLTDNTATLTAIANDQTYGDVFVYQLRIHYRPGDKLVAISASGNSPNIIAAAKWVKERGGKVIGLVGFDGGELKSLCDVVLHVQTPKGEYGPVEDIHLMVNHLVTAWLRYRVGPAQ